MFGGLGAPLALFTGGFSICLVWAAAFSLVLAILIFVVVSFFGNTMGDMLLGLGKRLASENG